MVISLLNPGEGVGIEFKENGEGDRKGIYLLLEVAAEFWVGVLRYLASGESDAQLRTRLEGPGMFSPGLRLEGSIAIHGGNIRSPCP